MKTTLVLAFSALALAACSVKLPGITLPGGGKDSGGPTSAGTSPPTSTSPGPAPDAAPSQPIGDLAPYYASLALADLYQLIEKERQDQIYERAKAAVGRDALWRSPNPDPTWIRDWRQRNWADASENAEALTQAAFNRAWEASCVAEFAASHKVHAELAAALAPELARVDALENYYARMAGYVALAAAFEDGAATSGLAIDSDPSGPVGYRVTILARAVAYHNQSRHAFRAFPWDRFPTARRVREAGRELSDDLGLERAAYCAAVARRGGVATTPITRIWSDGHMSARRVAWPTVTGDAAATRARITALVEAARPAFATAPALRLRSVDKLASAAGPPEAPTLVELDEVTVAAVRGATVTVARTDRDRYAYACRVTNRVERIDDNGRFVYQQICKYGDQEWRLDGQVTFAELPPGVALAVGDVISFAADVDNDTHKVVKDTPAKKASVRRLTLTGRDLETVKRGAQQIW